MQRLLYAFLTVFTLVCLYCCEQKRKEKSPARLRLHVGDIAFDSSTDDPNFKICSRRIYQYYNFGRGNFSIEKKTIRKHFNSNFKRAEWEPQSGYITIRFVVNCEGKTDRFRVFEIDKDWNDTHFSQALTSQLLVLTKSLTGWKPGRFDDSEENAAFYQYLTFKIHEGNLVDILP